ncbi:MAG: lysylphosphatidylglycerol synthase transmembrane domain-containing protein [Nitrospirota bacterium]
MVADDTQTEYAPPLTVRTGVHALLKKTVFLIPLGIAGNMLALFFSSTGLVLPKLSPFSLLLLTLTALLAVVPWFTDSFRIYLWGRFLGAKVSYPGLIRVVIGGELGAAVSPPVIGGSAVKTALMTRLGIPTGTALSLTLLSGIEDGIVFLVLVPIALTVSSSWDLPFVKHGMAFLNGPLIWAICGAIASAVMTLLLVRKIRTGRRNEDATTADGSEDTTRLRDRLRQGWRDFSLIFGLIAERGKALLALTLLISAFQWLCRYSVITLLVMSLDLPTRPLVFFSLQVILFAAMNAVPTPGAVGGAEALFALLYRPFLPAGSIALVMVGWRFFTFYLPAIFGAIAFSAIGIGTSLQDFRRNGPGNPVSTPPTDNDRSRSPL